MVYLPVCSLFSKSLDQIREELMVSASTACNVYLRDLDNMGSFRCRGRNCDSPDGLKLSNITATDFRNGVDYALEDEHNGSAEKAYELLWLE